MGRAFTTELSELEETYAWARDCELGPLTDSLRRARGPMLAVGSGGSFTAANLAAALHEETHGEIARAATPLDGATVAPRLRCFHALVVSAGGRNRDALQACETLLKAEPVSATVLCASSGSPLAQLARRFGATVFEFAPPVAKDGFLATNSLLAFCTLLLRAYSNGRGELPHTLPELINASSMDAFAANVAEQCRQVVEKDVLLVLHGPSARAAALDIESKFSEAALGSVHLSDYRNFGHGRHHWLAKRANRTAVVALVHETDEPLATRTLAPLPREVPRYRIELGGKSHESALVGLVAGFYLVAAAGARHDIDPGRPGVPAFGSRLYSLRMAPPNAPSRVDAGARRKAIASGDGASIVSWRALAERALDQIRKTPFTGVALDYDGTLCAAHERFGGLRADISRQLVRLLEDGLWLGVATGRGKSVGEALREALPKRLWPRIMIAYYNGGFVAALSEDVPRSLYEPPTELTSLVHRIERDDRLASLARTEIRRPQITIEPVAPENVDRVWDIVQAHVLAAEIPGVTLVRSSHSLDILAPGVSKLKIVAALTRVATGEILRIGDQGRFPGNDFALLDTALGLSVDQISSAETACWNFAPAGIRGVAATMDYLAAIRSHRSAFRLVLEGATS